MKKRLSIPLLLCAGGVVYALVSAPPQLVAPEPAASSPEEPAPDSYAVTVSLHAYGEDGRLLDRTDARLLRRFEGQALLELEAPRRWGHDGDGGWVASAQRGELSEQRDVLHLRGDVRLRHEVEGVEFVTEAMQINLDRQTARSLAPVHSSQGDNETRADTLWVNLDTEVAVLTGNVRSVYVPRP